MVGLVARPNLKMVKLASFNLIMALQGYFYLKKSTVFFEFICPAECPLRPLENSKCHNKVKSCEFRESEVKLDD